MAKVAAKAEPTGEPNLPVGQRVRALRKQAWFSLAEIAQAAVSPYAPGGGRAHQAGQGLGHEKLGTLIAGGEERPYTAWYAWPSARP